MGNEPSHTGKDKGKGKGKGHGKDHDRKHSRKDDEKRDKSKKHSKKEGESSSSKSTDKPSRRPHSKTSSERKEERRQKAKAEQRIRHMVTITHSYWHTSEGRRHPVTGESVPSRIYLKHYDKAAISAAAKRLTSSWGKARKYTDDFYNAMRMDPSFNPSTHRLWKKMKSEERERFKGLLDKKGHVQSSKRTRAVWRGEASAAESSSRGFSHGEGQGQPPLQEPEYEFASTIGSGSSVGPYGRPLLLTHHDEDEYIYSSDHNRGPPDEERLSVSSYENDPDDEAPGDVSMSDSEDEDMAQEDNKSYDGSDKDSDSGSDERGGGKDGESSMSEGSAN